MNARYDELERLQRLRENGALTEEEFQLEKRRLLGLGEDAGAPPPGRPVRTESVEIIDDEEAPRSRTALYVVLGGIGLIVAIAIGLLLGRDVSGGKKAPEANVVLPENSAAAADENLIAPPPPPDIRTMPLSEQMSRACAAAFGAKDQAQLQIAGSVVKALVIRQRGAVFQRAPLTACGQEPETWKLSAAGVR